MVLDDENEDVVENITENTEEQTVEEIVEGEETTTEEESEEKFYTEADIDKLVNEKINQLLPSKIEREKSKIQRENQETLNKYKRLEKILGAGLQTDNLDEIETKLTSFYKEQGIEIPAQNPYSDRDISILAKAEADEIISGGYEEVASEVDRLASKGVKNMNEREKILFQKLAKERKRQESMKELAKIGVGEKEIQEKGYQEFAKNLNPEMSEKDKYEMYLKYKPKSKKIEPLGSMKGTETKKDEVKDFYTFEEAKKFTREDYLKNPKLMKAVEDSSAKW